MIRSTRIRAEALSSDLNTITEASNDGVEYKPKGKALKQKNLLSCILGFLWFVINSAPPISFITIKA